MESSPRVVITGVGVVSPIGIGEATYWDALCQMRSGVVSLESQSTRGLRLSIGGAVRDFDGKNFVKPRKALKVMSREIQTGFSAASMAVEQAGLGPSQLPADRTGVIFGTEMLYCEPEEMVEVHKRCIENGEFHFSQWGPNFGSEMYPLCMLMYLPKMIACHVAIGQDARGPNNTLCLGEASSLLALIEAASIIRRGHADVMICGGSSSRLSITPMLYRGVDRLSRKIETPAAACRPFDAERDGMVNGEGAAAFILEREDFARARGAQVLTRVAGWGVTFGSREPSPSKHQSAIERSMTQALRAAELPPQEVGHVNAHASGTIEDDPWEAQAIRAVLGDVPVTAPKSFFGNIGSGGGAVELVASVIGLRHGLVPPTLNYTTPDPACPSQVVAGAPLSGRPATAMVLSQSGTGQSACVALSGD